MSIALEWNTRTGYALTELILFTITLLVVIAAIALSFIISFAQLTSNVSFFSTLRPLFENVLPSAIAFTAVEKCPGKGGKCPRKGRVNVVFLGHQERIRRQPKERDLRRVWVHVYFILLCGLIMVWAVSVFSDTIMYRKSSSCTDLEVEDTDLSCFLLSSRNIPEGVKQIIYEDKGDGDLVPCEEVQNYITSHNITYDLEVICYQYRFNPLAALGISYGAMKSIAFALISILGVLLSIMNKIYKECFFQGIDDDIESGGRNYKSRDGIPNSKIIASHVVLILLSIVMITILAIVLAIIHRVAGTKNSGYDFLRGERFYCFSVTLLVPITIIFTLGLFPWWAFEPLEKPPEWDIKDLTKKKQITSKMHQMVHNMVLHHKFSTGFAALLEAVVTGASKLTNDQEDDYQKVEMEDQ